MAVLLSRRKSAPKPYDTSAVAPELQTRAESSQILLDVGTATYSPNAAPYVLEQRILGIFEAVIDPAAIPLLFHEVRHLHQLQVSARVRLRDPERLNQLAHAKTLFDRQQAARKAQSEAITKRVEQVFGLSEL